jgi:hypothetical protein
MGQQRGSLGARVTSGSPWSAGCDESRTSGAEGGPGKRTGSNPDTAPRSDPYVIGKNGATAAVTLVERTSRFTAILALPEGKDSTGVADVLIEHTTELPAMMRKSLTWDQGSEMARHAALTLATDLPVYFADPHSPWQRPSNLSLFICLVREFRALERLEEGLLIGGDGRREGVRRVVDRDGR